MPGKTKEGTERLHHSDKWHRCWDKVQELGYDSSSAAAICTASIGREGSYESLRGSTVDPDGTRETARGARRGASTMGPDGRRDLIIRSALADFRVEPLEGIDYTVVPIVALVEGVIRALNSPNAEFVGADQFSIGYRGWDGRPIFLNHPMVDGKPVSGNTPTMLKSAIGKIFNTKIDGKRLCMEAWLHPVAAKEVIARLNGKKTIEVSTGALVRLRQATGIHDGKAWNGAWEHIIPDHLAILEDGLEGACSATMGCGIRAASMYYVEGKKMNTLRAAVQALLKANFVGDALKTRVRALVDEETFDESPDPNFTGETPVEASSEEMSELIQYQTIDALLSQCESSFAAARTLVNDLIAAEQEDPTETPEEEAAEEEIETAQLNSLNTIVGTMATSLYGIQELCRRLEQSDYPMVKAMRAAIGKRNSAADQTMIQTMHDHSVKLGAECTTIKDSQSHCSCGGNMTKAERITALLGHEHNPLKDQKALEAASENSLKTLEAHCLKVAQDDEEAKKKKKAEDDAAAEKERAAAAAAAAASEAAKKPLTEEEYLAMAPESIRTMVAEKKASDAATKSTLMSSLKTAQKVYTEAELGEMSIGQLTKLATLAKVAEPVDYSGRGVARASADGDYMRQPPPDGYRIALAKKEKVQ